MHTYLLIEENNLANFDLGVWKWQGTCCQICAQSRRSNASDSRFAGEGRYPASLSLRAAPPIESGFASTCDHSSSRILFSSPERTPLDLSHCFL